MAGYQIVISIVQFFTLLALIGTLWLNRKEYKTRIRPYIRFDEIKKKDADKSDELEFDVNVRNIGQLPAKDAKLYGEILINGEKDTSFECETKGSVFPSREPIPVWIIGIKEVDKAAILNGSKTLQLKMTLDYYGSGKEKYKTSSNRTYDPNRNSWVEEEGNWS